jgi:hypothetical protein
MMLQEGKKKQTLLHHSVSAQKRKRPDTQTSFWEGGSQLFAGFSFLAGGEGVLEPIPAKLA